MHDLDWLLTPLILYALWAVALVLLLAVARATALARRKRRLAEFRPYGDEEWLDAFSRAHQNTLENLPIFAVVYLAAAWTPAQAPIWLLGWIALGARVAQSLIHISSRSDGAIRLRTLMQLTQVVCFAWLGVATLLAIYR